MLRMESRPVVAANASLEEFVRRVAAEAVSAMASSGDPFEGTNTDVPSNEFTTFERVNVTLRCEGWIRGSMSAHGDTLDQQIRRAVAKAALDRRFKGPITHKELLNATVEVWIQISSREINFEQRQSPQGILLGIEGAEVRRGDQSAYYKPSVAITSGLRTPRQFLAALCRKAGLPRDSWQDPATVVKATQWICIFLDAEPVPTTLRYLRRDPRDGIGPEMVAEWVRDSCTYFYHQQTCTGAISYIYDPVRDDVIRERLSILRACGCLYGLSKALDTPALELGSKVRGTATRLAKYLIGHSRTWQPGCRIIEDEQPTLQPKVGSTALMLLALSFRPLMHDFGLARTEFRESILRCQRPDGRFMTQFGKLQEGHKQVEFYPGQVLLALALEIEAGSSIALAMCEAAFASYRSHFTNGPTTAFAGWQIDAWSRLAIAVGREDYALFAFQQADWLLQRQLTENAVAEHVGGFAKGNRVPAFSSIVFVEALIAALQLAAVIGDTARQQRYRAAIRLGLQFCRGLLLREVPDAFLLNPDKCIGGVAMRLANLDVRCDVVQHFLTLALATYNHFGLIFS